MLVSTHLLATVVLGRALSLNEPETYIAIITGVAIDLDHLFVSHKWLHEAKQYLTGHRVHSQGNLHTWLQEPLFGITVAILTGLIVSYFWSSVHWWVIPLFLSLHIAMDSIMAYEHQPLAPFSRWTYRGWVPAGTTVETVLSCAGLVSFLVFMLIHK